MPPRIVLPYSGRPALKRAHGIAAAVRLMTAVIGAVVASQTAVATQHAPAIAWATVAYAAARLLARRPQRTLAIVDAALASTVIAMTGALQSPMLGFGMVVAVAAGLCETGLGAIAGSIVVAASVPALAHAAGAGVAELNQAVTWAVIFPIAGIAAGFAARVWAGPPALQPEQDRRRLAQDLHDGVAQTLAHLRLELDMLAHPAVVASADPEELARLARVAERTLIDVRDIIRDLSAPRPAGGLNETLEAYVRDMQAPHGPQLQLRIAGRIQPGHPATSDLFRIAQEAISNAVRHSGAQRVEIDLEPLHGGALRLRVCDDGQGMAAEARPAGLGLPGIKRRAAALGADCIIVSEPGRGTTIEVRTPPTLMRTAS